MLKKLKSTARPIYLTTGNIFITNIRKLNLKFEFLVYFIDKSVVPLSTSQFSLL